MWSGFPHGLQGGRNQQCHVAFRLVERAKLWGVSSEEPGGLFTAAVPLPEESNIQSQKGEAGLWVAKVRSILRTSGTCQAPCLGPATLHRWSRKPGSPAPEPLPLCLVMFRVHGSLVETFAQGNVAGL